MILAIVSGKGGVGKSTIAYNLGALVNGVVVDADIGAPDLPYGTGPTIHDVLGDRTSVSDAVIRRSSVRLLPCGRSLHGARACDITRLPDVLDQLEAAHETVIVDCPAGISAVTGLVLQAADRCLIVTTGTDRALSQTLRIRELVRSLNVGIDRVAVNNISGDSTPGDARRQTGVPVTTIDHSEKLKTAQQSETPITDSAPGCSAANQLKQLKTELSI